MNNPVLNERGSAGKVMLIILGIIVLLGVAAVALWKPVIQPLAGEAIPERLDTDTRYHIPWDTPEMTLTIPEGWVVQRALYNKHQAVIRTPDLEATITIDTWDADGTPSLNAAMRDHTDLHLEQLTTDTVALWVRDDTNIRTIAVGRGTTGDAKTAALITVDVGTGADDRYLPALAALLATVEVPE